MMKKLITIILFTATVLLPQSKVFTLEEAVQTGVAASKMLSISKSKIKSSEERVSEINAGRLPQLKLSAGYTRLSEVDPFEIKLPIFANPVRIQDVILDNWSVKVGITQPLFTGNRLSGMKAAAEKNLEAEVSEFESEINEETFRIITAYFNLQRSENLTEIISKNLAVIARRLDDAKNLFSNGMLTKNDLLKIEVQKKNIELKLLEANDNLLQARASFNLLLGLDINYGSSAVKADADVKLSDYDFKKLTEKALSQRNDLLAAGKRLAAGEEMVSANSSGWYPEVYLFGNFYYSRPNQRYQPVKDEFKESWDAGVALSWSLWDGGATSSKTSQAEQEVSKAKENISLLEDRIALEVYQSYLQYKTAWEKIQLGKIALEQSMEQEKIVESSFANSTATSSDVVDASNSRITNEIDLLNSVISFRLSEFRLLKAAGSSLREK